MLLLLFVLSPVLLQQQSAADPLKGSHKQRIGNYDFEIATEPSSPVAGSQTTIMLRVAGVNGDDLIDIPLTVRLVSREGGTNTELLRQGPVVLPAGHHSLEYSFEKPGRYVLYADLKDYAYSGETLTFTFFLDVAGPYDFFYYVLAPAAVAVGGGAAGAAIVLKRRKHRLGQADLR